MGKARVNIELDTQADGRQIDSVGVEDLGWVYSVEY